jgi:hypothetical protein
MLPEVVKTMSHMIYLLISLDVLDEPRIRPKADAVTSLHLPNDDIDGSKQYHIDSLCPLWPHRVEGSMFAGCL